MTLLSNLAEVSGVATGAGGSQSFTTGGNASGYLLDFVQVNAATNSSSSHSGNIQVLLCSDGGGKPGAVIATLTGPNPRSQAAYSYTAPFGIVLPPSATYWVTLANATNYFWYQATAGYQASDGWAMGGFTGPVNTATHTLAVNATALPNATKYFQDFAGSSVGDTTFTDGSQLFSTSPGSVAAVQDGTRKELQLTANGVSSVRSAYELPNLNPGTPVYAFSAKWNSQIYGDFSGGPAADGFSFNYGQLNSLSLADSTYAQESGYGVGLCLGVQTYSGGNPGFYIRVNGTKYVSHTYDPLAQWGEYNSTRHLFEVDWNYKNGMTVLVDGQTIFTNVPTYGFQPQAGDRFVWGARCGADTEEMRLDNIVVVTGGNLVQATPTTPYYSDPNSGTPPFVAFDGNNTDNWVTYAANGYVGATVAGTGSVLAYELTSGADTGSGSATDPTAWTLEGSNNNGTNWSACGAGGGYFMNREETRCWLATNASPFEAYRLNISRNNGASVTALGELRLYDFNATQPVWTEINDNGDSWSAVACSADGITILAATVNDWSWIFGYYGPSWTELNLTGAHTNWSGIACTADGNSVVGTVYNGGIYVIPNASANGPNWWLSSAPTESWNGVVSSTNGSRLAAIAYDGGVYTSVDGGFHWAGQASSPRGLRNQAIASSGDGRKLAVAIFNGPSGGGIYTSSDYGTNWTATSAPSSYWVAIASSADGNRLVAANNGLGYGGTIWYSTDAGAHWTQSSAPTGVWSALASSWDGSNIVATTSGGTSTLYTSQDGGVTWAASPTAPACVWTAVASSWDGRKLVAVSEGGGVWQLDVSSLNPLPVIVNQTVTNQTSTSATISAQVNPNGLDTVASLQWGTTAAYGNAVAVQSIGNGNSPLAITANLTGLSPGTYHYAAAGTNGAGTAAGPDATFTLYATNSFDLATHGNPIIATSTNSPKEQGVTNAIDGTVSTKYLNFDKLNTGFTVFPAATNVPVDALTFISAEDAPERDPTSFVVYGSLDGTNFNLVASNSIPLFPTRNSIQTIGFANTNAYPVYKIIFPTVADAGTANSMQIAQVEFLPYADITSSSDSISLTPLDGTVSGAGPAAALLDRQLNQPANKIVILNNTLGTVATITPAAGSSILKGFEIVGGYDDTSYPGRTPSTITVKGSNDSSTFTTLATVNTVVPTANMQIQGFSILGNTNAYSQYQIVLGAPQSGNVMQISELRLFGVTPPHVTINGSDANAFLSWPASGFILQQSTNLASINWVPTTNAVVITNGVSSAGIPGNAGNHFYRLKAQ